MKNKPKYSIFQNIGYSVKTTWKYSKLLLVLTTTSAVLGIVVNLVQLYIAPMILLQIEQAASAWELIGTILLFTAALLITQSLKTYADETKHIGSMQLKDGLSIALMRRGCTTSYPNELNTQFRGKQNEALGAISGKADASLDAMFPKALELVMAVVGFVLYLLILRNLNSYLMMLVIATSVLSFFAGRRANKWVHDHRKEDIKIGLHRNYIINLAMGNEMPKDIRIFGMRQWLDDVYSGIFNLRKAFHKKQEIHLLAAKVVDVILSLARNGIAYFYLINMALTKNLSASEFLLYFSAVTGFTAWITTILNNATSLHRISLLICEFREYMEWPEPFLFEDGIAVHKSDFDSYELRLENVSFRYDDAPKDTISNLNLTIRPGEKLAIVGLNGAGKTTLIKLLCGLLDPTQGRVLLNGQDIREYNRKDYYSLFAAVFQDFSRLEATVAQNVAQSVSCIDKDRVYSCIDKAGLTEAISELPQGIDSMLGKLICDDGLFLSGGQNQRLMLARALYKDAPILLLDEPTAALDPIAENDIYQKYNEMTAGRTSVYISHRLASTRFCDRIIFLADGGIAEEGTHNTLMEKGGEYYHLFSVQSKYYQEGGAGNEEADKLA